MDTITIFKSKKYRNIFWKDVYDTIGKYYFKHPKINDSTDYHELMMSEKMKKKIIPECPTINGTQSKYKLVVSDKLFNKFKNNYLQLVMMYTLYTFANSEKSGEYISYYDHDTDLLIKFSLEELLLASFYKVPIKGILFNGFLNKDILEHSYKVIDEQLINSEWSSINKKYTGTFDKKYNSFYKKIFGVPHETGDFCDLINENTVKISDNDDNSHNTDEYSNDDNSDNTDDNSNDDNKNTIQNKKENELDLTHACCNYVYNYNGSIIEMCTDLVNEEAHECFGDCGTNFIRNEQIKNIEHKQIFDFNKFVIDMHELDKNNMRISFNPEINPEYRHASYESSGRGEVVTNITHMYDHVNYVTSMDINYISHGDYTSVTTKYIGVNYF